MVFLAAHVKEIIASLKLEPKEPEVLRSLKQKTDDAIIKVENSIFALNGSLKIAARLTRGRFEKHPVIGNALKKMLLDVESLKKDSTKNIEVYKKTLPILEKLI